MRCCVRRGLRFRAVVVWYESVLQWDVEWRGSQKVYEVSRRCCMTLGQMCGQAEVCGNTMSCFVSDVQLALSEKTIERTAEARLKCNINHTTKPNLGLLQTPRPHSRNSTAVSNNPAHFNFNDPSADIGAETGPQWPPATWF